MLFTLHVQIQQTNMYMYRLMQYIYIYLNAWMKDTIVLIE